MPELRKDSILDRWVIISTDRAKRPSDYAKEPVVIKGGSSCPFCAGNEGKTPPEITALRPDGSRPDTPGWTVRVVPNKFPALQSDGNAERTGDGLFVRVDGVGAHEVIIESPDHQASLAQLPEKSIEDVLTVFRDRMVDLKNDPRFKYVLIFKNYGLDAGASLEHSHTQLIALPLVPKQVREELDAARDYHRQRQRCVFCDIIRQEKQSQARVVSEDEHFLTVAPYAPRFPFETWILPKQHGAFFEDTAAGIYLHLARALKQLLLRADQLLDRPPYNFFLHTSAMREETELYYHWHIEYMPKLTRMAGFEWGTGFYINATPPEESARALREVELRAAPAPANPGS
ncbi:MAG: galactose-1-phosphate uridylyltransferase [Acidobacteria bacterium]|nr:galactose-1-phosphate uridylyltransferase [Acidobacteriota bacterium]